MFKVQLLSSDLHYFQCVCHRPMNMRNYASSEEVRDKKEQNKKEEVNTAWLIYVASTFSYIGKCDYGTFICTSLSS